MSVGAPIMCGLVTDPPRAGECKLRILTDGSLERTRLVAVDCDGKELDVQGVDWLSWTLKVSPELPSGSIGIVGALEFGAWKEPSR